MRQVISLAAVAVGVFLLAATQHSPAPEQPMDFSHLTHAGDLQIECIYCHTYARRSPVAGVPTVARCMGCHDLVATESEQIETLLDHLERQEPVAWNRVYDLPDHTRFYHDRHVKAGVECASCHGPVETMERVREFQPLEMGWCVDCHVEQEASLDCLACHH